MVGVTLKRVYLIGIFVGLAQNSVTILSYTSEKISEHNRKSNARNQGYAYL